MDLKDYCENVNLELSVWKSRLSEVLAKMDSLPTGKKHHMFEEINGLHILMSELEERIEKLSNECRTEWRPDVSSSSVGIHDLSSRFNDKRGVLFDYDFGG